jgi:hypothetical protein
VPPQVAFSAEQIIDMQRSKMVGINEEIEAAEAARAALSTNSNSKATIKVLRQAKYIAALAMTTLATDKPFNDARHAVVTTLSDLVKAPETDPTPQQEKIEKAKDAIRNLLWDLKAIQELRLRRLADGDQL